MTRTTRAAELSSLDRDRTLRTLASERFDLAVIGGGITGAGIAYAASLLGLRVALLEARDYASGTSSRSTKLVHGGLRYLAQGEIGLVRETALERKEVRRRAPHLALPRWVVLPCETRIEQLTLRAGITLFEQLGAVERPDRHRNWSGAELSREAPLLRVERYPYASVYREYLTDDARLVIANLRAAAAHGACVASHVSVSGLVLESGRVRGVRVAADGQELDVRADCVVNAAGPWVESVRRLEQPQAAPWLHLSKGIHVALPGVRLPVRHVYMLRARDRRLLFVIPRGEIVYVGTTDTTYSAGPEHWPTIERGEVEYLLDAVARHFEVPPIGPGEVIGAWAGLRPLIAQPGRSPSEMSRRDEIHVGPTGLISIAGGKLTGYRPMARQVLAYVGRALGRSLGEPRDDEPLPGGESECDAEQIAKTFSWSGSEAARERLARLYGSEVYEVLELGSEPLSPESLGVTGEIEWAVCREGALTLEDIVYRRLRIVLDDVHAAKSLEEIARRAGVLLGWSDAVRTRELDAVRARLAQDLSFAAS